MRSKPRQAVGTIATAATVLIGSTAVPAPADQARGTLSVTVQVVASCGGTVATGGSATVTSGCAPDSAPLAVLTELPAPAPADATDPSSVAIEGTGELRYVTLVY